MSISKHPHFEWNHFFIHTDVSTQRWQVLWSSIRYDETIIMLVIYSADRSCVCSSFHAPVKQSCRTFMTNSPLCCQTMRKSWSLRTPVIPNVFRCENMLSIFFYKCVSCLCKSACSSQIVNTSAALYALPITETICQV